MFSFYLHGSLHSPNGKSSYEYVAGSRHSDVTPWESCQKSCSYDKAASQDIYL